MIENWAPRFACPECAAAMDDQGRFAFGCSGCGRRFECRDGIYRFLTESRSAAAQPFIRQYRVVREQDGYRGRTPEYYRALPCVEPTDPHAAEWRIRQESFRQLQSRVLDGGGPLCILDVGAGNGWLSHRLTSLGHQAVAVDWHDDEQDGLGACRHYAAPIPRVQADFDALPFAPCQFDVVVFNGSLHYAPDIAATLGAARRILAPGGALVVMDSPMFRDDIDGHQMVAEKLRRFRTEYGITDVIHPSLGFLTEASLASAAERLALRGRFLASRGPLVWRARRQLSSLRMRRAAASFGVWVAR
jgi:SAM-dependent methyltransferase